jgi:hypothetical protein
VICTPIAAVIVPSCQLPCEWLRAYISQQFTVVILVQPIKDSTEPILARRAVKEIAFFLLLALGFDTDQS